MTPVSHTYCLLVLLFLVLCGNGCKDNGTPLGPGVSLISGSWVWQRSVGGFFPHVLLPAAGSITVDTFSPLGSFSRRRDGSLIVTARYTVQMFNDSYMVEYDNIRQLNGYQGGPFLRQIINVEGDTLRLADYACDLFVHTYARARYEVMVWP